MSSYSSISSVQRCHRARILRSAMKGCNKTSDALIFGTAYHESIENKDVEVGVRYLEKHNMEDSIPLLKEMYQRFVVFITRLGIEILENEVEFKLTLDEGEYEGKIDAILKWKDEIYLGEFKTAKYLTLDHIDADAQITSYLWACDKLDKYHPKGLIWIGNKKASEKQPVILKNGHLSVAKNQGVPYNIYEAKAKEMYGDDIPESIQSYMRWLKVNDNPSIAMVVTHRNEQQKINCERTIKQLMKIENEIMTNYREKGITEALRECITLPDKMCMQTCLYKDICSAMYVNDGIITDEDVNVYIEGLKEAL